VSPPLAGSRLYAILDVELLHSRRMDPDAVADAWLSAGIRLIQLRAKVTSSGAMLELARRLVDKAGPAGAELIVNDRADIARLSMAAGVHVGQTDLSPEDARVVVGTSAVVGVSTHNREQVQAAVRQPVDYLAIGPVFATTTKARPDPEVGRDGVREAVELAAIADKPVVAIGGITLETAPGIIDLGAAAVAVVGDLLTDEPERRARLFLRALQ
jgi:thiamine-phosphate pyrophosphorylase